MSNPAEIGQMLVQIEAKLKALERLENKIDRALRRLESLALDKGHYLGDYTALTRIKNGCRILVDTRDRGLGSRLLTGGFWEQDVSALFEKLLKPGDVFLDIGASYGFYSLLASRIVGPGGLIHAFEPNPRVFRLLCDTFHLNGMWNRGSAFAHEHAVADQKGQRNFRFREGHLAQGSAFKHEGRRGQFVDVEVSVVTLDEFLPEIVPDVVKIDTEGADARVLFGMRQIIERSANLQIIYEFTPLLIAEFLPLTEFFDFVEACKLNMYLIGRAGALEPASRETLARVPRLAMVLLSKSDANNLP